MWRPKGWDMPEYIAFDVCEDDRQVSHKIHTGDSPRDIIIFEAGADAMLEALITRYKVKMPPDFKSILLVIPEEVEE